MLTIVAPKILSHGPPMHIKSKQLQLWLRLTCAGTQTLSRASRESPPSIRDRSSVRLPRVPAGALPPYTRALRRRESDGNETCSCSTSQASPLRNALYSWYLKH